MGQEESHLASASGPPATLEERSLEAVADYIKSGNARRIVVLTGAGISTAAGIPDFRSPKTGLYSNLARLKLPYAEAVFDISYFRNHPEPFYVLAQELYPGKFHPTISHAFIALLAEKGLLQMLFTQNIDCLERAAGVPADKIVEAHGSFATQRCIECKVEFPDAEMRAHVTRGDVPKCNECKGLVKPDITFFGEALPRDFSEKSHNTVMADLVLIIGTSLTVYPFASLPEMARKETPRVLFNMEKVGSLGSRVDDVLELGACDDGIRKLAELLGWTDELDDTWRNIVGNEEAERQLRSQTARDEEIEDELQKLTGEIETVLKLEEEEEKKEEKKAEDEEKSQKVGDDAPSDAQTPKGDADAKETAKTDNVNAEQEKKGEERSEADSKPVDEPTSSTAPPKVQESTEQKAQDTTTAQSKDVEEPTQKEGEEKPQQN
ncbi:sir2 family domain-containing protein [Trichoderma breve]|uniref:Sir2 family domain-containing protein n=1 Tax=Trichoderma breve TaxID=2034170 RepID=A0A9W9E584_9HYPO|nr:sir2 family domain-containing protein [Trichoderma breve]KAJ4857077.1 sir2 family domain-containing protein [Trichoderma breve]